MERKGDDGGTGPRRQRGVRDKGEGDGRTEEQGQGGKRNGRQKDRRTEKKEKGKEDRRTEEQGQGGKGKGRQKDKRTKTGGKGNRKKGHADRKKPVNFLQKPWSNLTEPLEQCSSYPVALLRGCWRKITEVIGNHAGTR